MEDYCAFGFGDPLGEEGGVSSWGGWWCRVLLDLATLLGRRAVSVPGEEGQWKIVLLDLATLLGRRVVSVPGEEGGVSGRLLCFWIWRPSWGGGWCRFLGRRVVSVEDYCVFGFGDSPGEEVGGE